LYKDVSTYNHNWIFVIELEDFHQLDDRFIKYSDRTENCLGIIPNYNQQDATFLELFISTDALTKFQAVPPLIIRST